MKENLIKNYLLNYKKKKITLLELESILPCDFSYEKFSDEINILINENILKAIKSSGYSYKSKKLPNAYTIMTTALRVEVDQLLYRKNLYLNENIALDFYFKNLEKYFYEDEKYIDMINVYLNSNKLPLSNATIPERSYLITGNEKWLQEEGGLKVLERLKLSSIMMLCNQSDPVMFAINKNFSLFKNYKHLIVENKSIYYLLLKILDSTTFTTIIYGSGWKIASDLSSFKLQFPFKDKDHIFYYFGDFDNEGIKIWSYVNKKYNVLLAIPLYEALFKCSVSKGKTRQIPNNDAIILFTDKMKKYSKWIIETLKNGEYIPQEALDSFELKGALNEFD